MPKKKDRAFETKTVKRPGFMNRLMRRTWVLQRYEGDDTWVVRSQDGS